MEIIRSLAAAERLRDARGRETGVACRGGMRIWHFAVLKPWLLQLKNCPRSKSDQMPMILTFTYDLDFQSPASYDRDLRASKSSRSTVSRLTRFRR